MRREDRGLHDETATFMLSMRASSLRRLEPWSEKGFEPAGVGGYDAG
jgi:hypothetical protein